MSSFIVFVANFSLNVSLSILPLERFSGPAPLLVLRIIPVPLTAQVAASTAFDARTQCH